MRDGEREGALMTSLRLVEHLAAARAIVVKGWCQGRFRDAAGKHCTAGALAEATKGYSIYGALVMVLASGLPAGMPFESVTHAEGRLITWNDMPERTLADVLELFDTVIAKLEEGR